MAELNEHYTELRDRLEDLGWDTAAIADLVVATLPDGRAVVVHRELDRWLLYWASPLMGLLSYDGASGFCYLTLELALASLQQWEAAGCVGEPQGWFRHISTARRRPGGDAAREYIHP